jgi:hypothetical protein
MIMSVNLSQIHRNLKSAAIWDLAEILYSQGVPLQIQISAQSGRQSRNLAKTFCFQHFSPDLRFWRNSPHYMWAKPQGFFATHVDVCPPASTISTLTGGHS